MDTKEEIVRGGDIARVVKRGALFIGASFVVGSLILSASITASYYIRCTLFAIAATIVLFWAGYVVLRFILRMMAARKHGRENANMERRLSGRMTVSNTGNVMVTNNVESNPIPVKD